MFIVHDPDGPELLNHLPSFFERSFKVCFEYRECDACRPRIGGILDDARNGNGARGQGPEQLRPGAGNIGNSDDCKHRLGTVDSQSVERCIRRHGALLNSQ